LYTNDEMPSMEKFIVSARKYRPQNFSTVVGQSHITTTLKNAIFNNQLAHAFLFCGPRGVGKTTCARILAKTINCENKTADGEACNTCNSCTSFDAGTSLNIHELDAASNNSVDDIRSLVEQVRFSPQAGKYKVYIVDEVHMLSASAFNAFLKTLEEPPSYAIFILATTEKHKILPTILSRCQIFDFKRITTSDTVEHLAEICAKESIEAEKTALHVIAQKSEGCMRDSLSILDKIVSFTSSKITYSNTLEHLNILDEDYFFNLLKYFREQNLTEALLLFDTINQKGFEGDTFLDGVTEFFRNLLVSKDAKAAMLLDVAEDFRAKYIEVANSIDTNWIIAAINCITEANNNYKTARNKRLSVEMTLIKLCYLQQAIEVSNSDVGLVKKNLTSNQKAIAFKAIPSFAPIKAIQQATPAPTAKVVEEKQPSLVIQTAKPVVEKKPIEPSEPAVPQIASLSKLKAKILAEQQAAKPAQGITEESLQQAWKAYTEILFEQKKHPSVTQFNMAKLRVDDSSNFTIITEGNVEKRFIENERAGLSEFLQSYFNNNQIKYTTEVALSEKQQEEQPTVLSSKQQYLLIAQKYPLIQVFKDNLKLELE
jgi:DNA polymerase III subunit gamma/tau